MLEPWRVFVECIGVDGRRPLKAGSRRVRRMEAAPEFIFQKGSSGVWYQKRKESLLSTNAIGTQSTDLIGIK